MSAREVIAYAITHAGRDAKGKAIKGGPYEGEYDKLVPTLREAWRGNRRRAKYWLAIVRRTVPHARVIRIVRARPSEASAVEVLREVLTAVDDWDADRFPMSRLHAVRLHAVLMEFEASARRVLAASGPDPSAVVRAAMAEEDARVRMVHASYAELHSLEGDWLRCVEATRVAVKAYRKAGGK